MYEIKSITLRTNEYASRRVDQIEINLFDMTFHKDICSERDIRLAGRMAEAAGVELYDYRDKSPAWHSVGNV